MNGCYCKFRVGKEYLLKRKHGTPIYYAVETHLLYGDLLPYLRVWKQPQRDVTGIFTCGPPTPEKECLLTILPTVVTISASFLFSPIPSIHAPGFSFPTFGFSPEFGSGLVTVTSSAPRAKLTCEYMLPWVSTSTPEKLNTLPAGRMILFLRDVMPAFHLFSYSAMATSAMLAVRALASA